MAIQFAVAGNGFPQQPPLERIPALFHSSGVKIADKPKSKPVDMQSAAAEVEKVSLAFNKKLKFVVDHQSHEVTVKVIDPSTDKVIKVLPPEELQRLHARLKETIGVLFDEKI
jgi:flagellar protein FlaG